MKTSTKVALTVVGMVLGLQAPAFAQTTAKEGLERIKTNLNNSRTNLGEYQKNLKTVEFVHKVIEVL